MQSTAALRDEAAKKLATDTATLAPAANANHMSLLKAPIAPSESVGLGDLTFADFDGSTPLDVTLGAQAEALDPATNDSVITLSPPVGGWRWVTTGITNLPQTIYGVALMDKTDATVLATEAFPVPIVLTAIDQVVDIGPLELRLIAGSLT
jgi:hypothetical protein